jgi:cyclopropane-fatty-acyl-phospholipid synthase
VSSSAESTRKKSCPSTHLSKQAARLFEPLARVLVGHHATLRIEFWDGSSLGATDPKATIRVNSPMAIRRILYAGGNLGVARAYVAGDIDLEGDLLHALQSLTDTFPKRLGLKAWGQALLSAARLGAIGRPPRVPPEEVRLKGGEHSRDRDAAAISHHYDLANDFYRLVLGPSMAYSCAFFEGPEDLLEDAQIAKYDLVCRKLELVPDCRLLDVGCGWGGMVCWAAERYKVQAVGITVSRPQYELALERVAQAGLQARVEIRLQDYRELAGETYDAISSIGMFEHVGRERSHQYFQVLGSVLRPGGLLLNHAISAAGGTAVSSRSFIGRYVFPDGELQDVADVIAAMQASGLEIRHVESLREHYPKTLHKWKTNLERHWDEVVNLVGPARARIWRLFMTGGIIDFERATFGVHQVLGRKLDS